MPLFAPRQVSTSTRIENVLWDVFDWVFPPRCAGCGVEGEIVCAACLATIEQVTMPCCRYCASPLARGDICAACRNLPHSFEAFASYAWYNGPIRKAIHQLKYQNDIAVGRFLSAWLYDLLAGKDWEFDMVVPVPLSTDKLEVRGYNQAARLAKPLARLIHKSYQPLAMSRVRETKSQVGLNIQSRHDNVRDAFRGSPAIVRGRSILLVDDVCTTGATLQSAAAALKQAGAAKVYALTLAKAKRKDTNVELS